MFVAPGGFCVIQDVGWGKPEGFQAALAMESRLIVVVRGRGIFRFSVREEALDMFGFTLLDHHQVCPVIVAKNAAIA